MSRSLVLILYKVLLPVFFIVAFPAWLLKMWKRGGYGTGLLERFARFKRAASAEPKEAATTASRTRYPSFRFISTPNN